MVTTIEEVMVLGTASNKVWPHELFRTHIVCFKEAKCNLNQLNDEFNADGSFIMKHLPQMYINEWFIFLV